MRTHAARPATAVGVDVDLTARAGAAPSRTTRAEPPTIALVDRWRDVADGVGLQVSMASDAPPLEDERVIAAVTAVLHGASDRAATHVLVQLRSDGSVVVHDDGGPPPVRLGVLTTTAQDALRALGADLEHGDSDRLEGTAVVIVPPAHPRAA